MKRQETTEDCDRFHLLAFARRQTLQPKSTDIKELVEGNADMLRRMLGESFPFKLKIEATPTVTHCDPGQLESVLLNLVLNARDASEPAGTITLRVARHHFASAEGCIGGLLEPGGYICLSVQDNGCGISDEMIQRVWEPFVSTKGEGHSGMSMALGFASQSGGGMRIKSALGEGSEVSLFLPLAQDTVEEEQLEETKETLGAVLLVEDDPNLRKGLLTLLKLSGYKVIGVGSQEEALEVLLSDQLLVLVITDIILKGGGSGIKLF